MFILKRFTFWLFLLSVSAMLFELIYNPVINLYFLDKLFLNIVFGLDKYVNIYDHPTYQLKFSGALIHVLLYTFYGYILDLFVAWLKKNHFDKL